MMKEFGKLPDDPFYEHINPYLKVWLYEGWIHDRELETERLKQHGILIGSFFNPEMAQKMIKDDKPDFETTDLDETSKAVRAQILEATMNTGRKKRRKHKVVE